MITFRLPTPRPGEVLGLVGTNGIGKSTALKILAGKLKPNLGRYAVRTYFFLPETSNLHEEVFKEPYERVLRKLWQGQSEVVLSVRSWLCLFASSARLCNITDS